MPTDHPEGQDTPTDHVQLIPGTSPGKDMSSTEEPSDDITCETGLVLHPGTDDNPIFTYTLHVTK